MALISCPECKKEISDLSEKCIHCGFPLQKQKSKECNLVIKAEKYPSNDMTSCRISIMNLEEEELAVLHTGTGITSPIHNEMQIYAKYTSSPLANKCKSNIINVKATKNTRLQIGYQRSFLLNKLYLYEVDQIDSE